MNISGFMISGTLNLRREKELPIKKVLRRSGEYALVILIFGWILAISDYLFNGAAISTQVVIDSFMNMLKGKSSPHLWYMYDLLGLTVALPMIKAISDRFDDKTFRNYTLLVMFIFLSVISFAEGILGFEFGVNFPFIRIGVFYFLLGSVLGNEDVQLRKPVAVSLTIAAVLLCIFDAYLYIYSYGMKVYGLIGKEAPAIVAYSASVFLIFKHHTFRENNWLDRVVQFLSAHSFGIYLIHFFWINVIYKALGFNPFAHSPLLVFLPIFIIVFLLSLACTFVMKHIPLLKNLL